MLLVEDSISKCVITDCTSGVGVCGSMWSGKYNYIESTYNGTMLLCGISYSVRLCIVHVSILQSSIGSGYGWCGM